MERRFRILFRSLVDALCNLEYRLNHPYWCAWPNYPSSHWGPLFPSLCRIFDWLSEGRCHD